MSITERIGDFVQLGKVMGHIATGKPWSGFELGLTEFEFNNMSEIIEKHKHINGWFEPEQIRSAMGAWGHVLTREKLETWTNGYTFSEENRKSIGVIMAGNIPLVGFHDFLSVLISGNKLIGKLSSDADRLLPALAKILIGFNDKWTDKIEWSEAKMKGYDAVIATGSNNTARYFEYYFKKVPRIIRKNRTGVAILDGAETPEEIKLLGKDIFQYYGLGCRNVSKIYVPQDFVLDRFFEGIYDFNEIVNQNKYANNYDYNRAIYLMNQDPFLENGFVCLKEMPDAIASPVGVVYYERYDDYSRLVKILDDKKEEIQCIISRDTIGYGQGQLPQLNDYADGVDTMSFLESLG